MKNTKIGLFYFFYYKINYLIFTNWSSNVESNLTSNLSKVRLFFPNMLGDAKNLFIEKDFIISKFILSKSFRVPVTPKISSYSFNTSTYE